MCGITGAINFRGLDKVTLTKIKICTDKLFHRGPDADGLWNNKFVSLGHRRLSIIDLSEDSNQPMFASDGSVAVVFNGEIYNHEEIKKDLSSSFDFKTDHSDTEVIINAYKKWGIKCLEHFSGMFAFAIYDIKLEKVFLARDRLGKKPLYWTNVDGTFYFSSESQAFFEADILKKQINAEAIYHYLTFLAVPAPQSFYNGVSKLEAGYYMEVTKNGLKANQYWNVANFLNMESKVTFSEAVTESDILLKNSMGYRNVADVPISIALSGGLDSSLNLFFTNKHRSDRISTINISYEETSEFDESKIAEKYSNDLSANYISKCISQADFISWIEEYLSISKDIPTGDPNTALMYGICKIARENGFKVLLVGEGGDELGGYPIYTKLEKLYKITRYLTPSILGFLGKFPVPKSFSRKINSILDCPVFTRRFLFGFTEKEKKSFWKLNQSFDSYSVIKSYCDEVRNDLDDSFLRKILNTEYKLRLAELLLPRVDYPSMAASIEARAPFMDHKLIEYTCSLSFRQKMRNGPKTIIREIAKKVLPQYIMNQPKVGFGMLLTPFLKDIMPDWFKNEVLKENSPVQEYIHLSYLEKIYDSHTKYSNEGYRMWILFSLNKWLLNNR